MNLHERYQALSSRDQEEFTRVLNKLLSVTFLTKRNEENKKDYYFIERNEELFNEYLRMSGWKLMPYKVFGVFGVMNEGGYNRLKLRLEESLIVLIIRLCYEEKRKEVNVTENISIRVGEIQEKYAALKIRNKPIDKKSLTDTLNLLKRFNILNNLDANITHPDCRLLIFPSILFAVRVDDISNLFELIDGFGSEKQSSEEDVEEE